jgi:hypothetical protein
MKLIVKKMYPLLEDYFSLGEEITLTPNLYTEDTTIVRPTYTEPGILYFGSDIVPPRYVTQEKIDSGVQVSNNDGTIAPKGSVKDYSFTNAKGMTYEADRLVSLLGYRNGLFSNIFEKC